MMESTVKDVTVFRAATFLNEVLHQIHAFFCKQHFHKQRQAEIGKKISKS